VVPVVSPGCGTDNAVVGVPVAVAAGGVLVVETTYSYPLAGTVVGAAHPITPLVGEVADEAKFEGEKQLGGVQVYVKPSEGIPGVALTVLKACELLFAVPAVEFVYKTVVLFKRLLKSRFEVPLKPT